MSNYVDTLRATMQAFGYPPDRIDAALNALSSGAGPVDPHEEDPYLSPKDICRKLSISTTTLWRHHPPFHQIGGRNRFRISEVVRYLGAKSPTKAMSPEMGNGISA